MYIESYVRGYHAYMDIWTPVIGQALLLKREPTNSQDVHAVAIYFEDQIDYRYRWAYPVQSSTERMYQLF